MPYPKTPVIKDLVIWRVQLPAYNPWRYYVTYTESKAGAKRAIKDWIEEFPENKISEVGGSWEEKNIPLDRICIKTREDLVEELNGIIRFTVEQHSF